MTTDQSTSTAVATTKKDHPVIQLLDSDVARRRIEPMLPRGASYDQVMVETYLAVQKNADLADCTPASLVQSVARAVGTGGTIGRDVHLVPFGKQCQIIEDYKFLAEMVVRTGGARSLTVKAVYANESFLYEEGTEQVLRHVPIMDPAKRGALVGAYAIARLSFNNLVIHVMSAQEIEAIRQKYSNQWKSGAVPTWYALKTCVRQIVKLLPKNAKLAALLGQFNAPEEDVLDIGDAPEVLESPAPRQLNMPTTQYEGSEIEAVGRVEVEDMADPYADGDGFQDDRDLLELEPEDEPTPAKSKGRRDAMKEG
jgi:recombination protein RecT